MRNVVTLYPTEEHFLISRLAPGTKLQRAKEFWNMIFTIIEEAHSTFPEEKKDREDWARTADQLTDENWLYF